MSEQQQEQKQAMTPKEYLSQVRRLNVLIDQRIEQKAELSRYTGVGATDYTKDKVQSSPAGEAPYVKAVEKILALEEEIDMKVDEYVSLKNKIISEIQSLQDPKHIDLLFKKYIQFKRLEEIAVEMNYSYQYAINLHGWALKAFEEAFPAIFEKM